MRFTLGVLVVLLALPEIVLTLADAGWLGTPRWRWSALSHAAFWRGLLFDWQPNYPGQALAMFLTYGFLHGSVWHMAGNLAALWWLTPRLLDAAGPRGFWALYLASLLGGPLAFVVLSTSFRPMVGASGAVYGLAAAWIWFEARTPRPRPRAAWIVPAQLSGLIALNLAGIWLTDGNVAWQTHLGGMILGWICARFVARPRARP